MLQSEAVTGDGNVVGAVPLADDPADLPLAATNPQTIRAIIMTKNPQKPMRFIFPVWPVAVVFVSISLDYIISC